MIRAVILIIILHQTEAYASILFQDSLIFSNRDFHGARSFKHTVQNVTWMLYGTSDGTNDFKNNVTISITTPDGSKSTYTLYSLVDPGKSGELKPLKITANSTLIISIGNEDTASNMFFYLVKQVKDSPAVYNVGSTPNFIASDRPYFFSSVTFLSASPHFTLSGFDIDETATVDVYPTGWDAVVNKEIEDVHPVLTVRNQDAARISSVTILGPIATVALAKNATSKVTVSIYQGKGLSSLFQPDAAFTVLSPGFISIHWLQSYQNVHSGNLHYEYSSDTEVTANITVQTGHFLGNLTVTTTSNGVIVPVTYSANSKMDASVTKMNKISVDYNPARTSPPVFIVQIQTSIENAPSFNFLIMVFAFMLTSIN